MSRKINDMAGTRGLQIRTNTETARLHDRMTARPPAFATSFAKLRRSKKASADKA